MTLVFSLLRCYTELNALRKGGYTCNGLERLRFLQKRETPKLFRLEVYPFYTFQQRVEHVLCAPQLCYGALLFCIDAFPLSKPLPLGEVSPKVTERARPLTEKLLYSDTLTLTKRQLIAAQRLCHAGLALSGAHAPALPKGRASWPREGSKQPTKGTPFLSIIIEKGVPP